METEVNGEVFAAIPDGNGGWYIGGSFSRIGNMTIHGLAHINATGIPSIIFPQVNSGGQVNAHIIVGNRLFVGGNFSNLGGFPRSNFGVIDLSSTTVDSFSPSVVGGEVYVFAFHNNKLYLGGTFDMIVSNYRTRIAALDLTNWPPILDAWSPSVTGTSTPSV